MDRKDIVERFAYLRNSLGRPIPKHNEISIGVVERKRVSIQGYWKNSPDTRTPPLREFKERHASLRETHGFQQIVNEFGLSGVVRITQKLLEKQQEAKEKALAALPPKIKIRATE